MVQAGTALSTRLRGGGSSFNVLRMGRPYITVGHYQCEDGSLDFNLIASTQFIETDSGWKKLRTDLCRCLKQILSILEYDLTVGGNAIGNRKEVDVELGLVCGDAGLLEHAMLLAH